MTELGFRTTGRVRHRRGRGAFAVFVALAVLAGGAAFLAMKGQAVLAGAFATPDFTGPGRGEVVVQVHDGDTTSDIALRLEEQGVVKSVDAFTSAAKQDPRSLSIQPGFYRLRSQMAGAAALELILDPEAREMGRVTVAEGLRQSEAISALAKGTAIPEKEFATVLKSPGVLGLPSYAKNRPEGFLFPATYDVDPATTAETLLQKMVQRYRQAAKAVGLQAGARKLGRSQLEVVIVASLVESEARRTADFPKVARVIYNRLAERQLLQLDSTVHYAVGKTDRVSTTAKDRANSSPYNTYRHTGLPPGPIAAPGEEALRAALRPASGGWMYFVTVNPDTGATKFAETLAEHDTYVQQFRQWCSANSDRC